MPTAWDVLPNNVIPNDRSKIAKPKIAIAIPYNGKWEPEWVSKVYVPLNHFTASWCDKVSLLCRVQSISVARDTLVNNALQANCDYIFFADTDHIFESPQDPNTALNMLYQCINKDQNSKDGKIVSGLYRSEQETGFNYSAWIISNRKGFLPIQNWSGNWLDVDITGLGCTLISTDVFRNIPRPYFLWETIDSISEYFYFFELAKSHGYNTHVYTDVKMSHLGNLKVKFDGTIAAQDM